MSITLSTNIPQAATPYIVRLRKFLQDTPELNRLEGVKECSDEDLYYALLDTIEEINFDYGYFTTFSIGTFPSWNALKYGATLQLLVSKGILSARNTINYQDSGGVMVQDYDRYGRYMNFFNLLFNKYNRAITNIKVHLNAEACYGGIGSEYALTGDD